MATNVERPTDYARARHTEPRYYARMSSQVGWIIATMVVSAVAALLLVSSFDRSPKGSSSSSGSHVTAQDRVPKVPVPPDMPPRSK